MESEFTTVKNQEVRVRMLQEQLQAADKASEEASQKAVAARDEFWTRAMNQVYKAPFTTMLKKQFFFLQLRYENQQDVDRLTIQISDGDRARAQLKNEIEWQEANLADVLPPSQFDAK